MGLFTQWGNVRLNGGELWRTYIYLPFLGAMKWIFSIQYPITEHKRTARKSAYEVQISSVDHGKPWFKFVAKIHCPGPLGHWAMAGTAFRSRALRPWATAIQRQNIDSCTRPGGFRDGPCDPLVMSSSSLKRGYNHEDMGIEVDQIDSCWWMMILL